MARKYIMIPDVFGLHRWHKSEGEEAERSFEETQC
jgi:hypothetical protein